MAHLHCPKQQFGWQLKRTLVSNFRLGQRPLCIAAAALAFSLQTGSTQASLSQTAASQASFHDALLAMDASAENHGSVTEPMAGRLAARDVDGQINIRKQPTVRSPIRSSGDNQDPLYIFKSALTPQGDRWYFVENIPTGEQGWVHGDYVLLNEPSQRFPSVPAEAMPIDPMTGSVDWETPHAVEERPEAGIISAQDAGAWVNVRSQPSIGSSVRHLGRSGEPIYIYRTARFSSPAGRLGVTELWHFVAFLNSGAEGWVRSDFVESAWESDEPFEVSGFGPQAGQLAGKAVIPLYRHASVETTAISNGQAGEAVMLLRKLVTGRGDRGWYFVELEASRVRGWVKLSSVLER